MNELSPHARRLFELARFEEGPDLLARNRVARALSAKLAIEASLVPAGASAAASAPAWGVLAAKTALVTGAAGTLLAAGWLTFANQRPASHPGERPQQTASPVRTLVEPATASLMPAKESLAPSPTAFDATGEPAMPPSHRRPTRPASQPQSRAHRSAVGAEEEPRNPPPDWLRDETEALRMVQQALRERTPQQALRLLDEQDLRFGDGLLHQERAAARILALCQAGRVEEARVHGLRFEASWPHSALLVRVRSACWSR
jgi:hypothetical protein